MGIIGGRVIYGKKVQPQQYFNDHAEVEFSWSAPEGSTEEQALVIAQHAQDMAVAKVFELLATKKPLAANPAPAPAAQRTKADIEREVIAAASQKPAVTAPAPRTAKRPPAQPKAEQEPQIRTNPEDRKDPAVQDDALFGDGDDFSSDVKPEVPVVEVTDADLNAACTKKNAALKNPVAIRGLIAQFGLNLNSIPKEKRAEFLEKLDALK